MKIIACVMFGIYILAAGMLIGKGYHQGESYELGTGTYNVVQVLGNSKEADLPGQELLVSDWDDPTDHHFVVVSNKCFASRADKAGNILTVVDSDFCIWSTD